MLSVTSVTGIRSFLSSHAVSRAPCRKGRVSHALDRPEEVDRRRPRGGEGPAQAREVAPEVAAQRARAERDPHGGGHADRRGAADHHVLDGARHLAVVAVDAVDLARGEESLVEHDHASIAPLDGSDRHAGRRERAYPNRARGNTLDPAPRAPLSSASAVSDFSQSYSVEIAGSLDDCFAVLIDFEAYPSLSGTVTESRVLESHPDGLPKRVAFNLDMTLKTVRYTLDYEYQPPRGRRWHL